MPGHLALPWFSKYPKLAVWKIWEGELAVNQIQSISCYGHKNFPNRWVIHVWHWNQQSYIHSICLHPASWLLLKCTTSIYSLIQFVVNFLCPLCSFNAICISVSSSLLFQALNVIQQLLNRSLITHRGGSGKSLLSPELSPKLYLLTEGKKYKNWAVAETEDLLMQGEYKKVDLNEEGEYDMQE